MIGVAINGTGFGFTEPPLLSLVDSCENGFGAGGFPIMGNVSPSLDENGDQIFNSNGDPIYIPDPNGTELGVVGAVITNSGQGYLPNTVETTLDQDGNLTEKEVIPSPNQNYDGAVSYVTTLEDVVIENTGFGYEDTDTLTVEGGTVTGSGVDDADVNVGAVQNPGQAQVELTIRDGLIVDANVVNSGFGFTDLPDLVINSDTGAGAKLKPVLKFTRVDDASRSADTNIPFDRNLSQDVVITVISCITK